MHLIILKSRGYFCSVEEKKLPYKVIGGKPTRIEYSADDIFAKIKQEEIRFIDLQFTSLPGRFHHTTISANTFTSDQMEDGLPKLDGSSIVGFTSIDDSDLILKPDPNSYAIIPWIGDLKSARMLCDIYRGAGRGRLDTDPRGICQKAEEYLKTQGFDDSYWGPEVEFFVFDKIHWDDVIKQGKGLILVINKWDLVEKETHTMKGFEDEIRYQFKALDHYPLLFISALTKQRIHRVLETVWEIYERGQNLVSTKKLNDTLQFIITKNPPPAEQGKVIQIKYATQVSREPAVIALYTNYPKKIKTAYRRYLENQLRKTFDFSGIPITLSFRRK